MAQSQFVTQQHRLASMAAWLSSTCISHHDLHPHIPSIHLSAVNSSPHTGIAPQSLNSSSQLSFQETRVSAQGVYGCSKDRLIFFPFRLPQSAVSLSALSASPFWLRQLPCCRGQIPTSVPPPAKGRSSPTNTPIFPLVPSSYQFLRGSIYSFPLVRSSCLLSQQEFCMHFCV